MPVKNTPRSLLLASALIATLAAAFWPQTEESPVAAASDRAQSAEIPTTQRNKPVTDNAPPRNPPSLAIRRPDTEDARPIIDLFARPAATSVAVLPRSTAAAPPPHPAFTYGGQYIIDGTPTYLVALGETLHRAGVGDTILDQKYRLETASPGEIQLLEVASGLRITLEKTRLHDE